jgi:hypothetical protein
MSKGIQHLASAFGLPGSEPQTFHDIDTPGGDTEVSRETFEATKAADKDTIGSKDIVVPKTKAKPTVRRKVKTSELARPAVVDGEALEVRAEKRETAKAPDEITDGKQRRAWKTLFKGSHL